VKHMNQFRRSASRGGSARSPDSINQVRELSAIRKLSFCDLVVAPVESNSIGQSSQVQTIADYAKLSLAGAKAIMLAPKEVHPQLATSLCIKTHSALLALCGAPHNASSRTGIRTWLLPSLVHKPRKAAENASCCCEAGSLAISKAWPMVIWSFRNASATGGMRSASLMRP